MEMFEAECRTFLMQKHLLPSLFIGSFPEDDGKLPFASLYCRKAHFCSDEIEAVEFGWSTAASDPVAAQVRRSIRVKNAKELAQETQTRQNLAVEKSATKASLEITGMDKGNEKKSEL